MQYKLATNRLKLATLCVMALIIGGAMLNGCGKEPNDYEPTPYTLEIPEGLPPMDQPADNKLTVEGIALGRRLFYDNILSGNYTQSCASCHKQELAFTDGLRFSTGIDNIAGNRNSMAIINQGYNRDFFWNGRSKTLEAQALQPVPNPIEMHLSWPDAVTRLQTDASYPDLFYKAFGTETIDSLLVAKALSQFMRTIVAGNSKFHKYLRNEVQLNQSELNGYLLFRNELKGDCQHCHELGSKLLTDNHFLDITQRFHNNGLDSIYPNFLGLAEVTLDPNDNGKFKSPTLINIALTAPYMHDGRFNTLQEVIEHYDHGVKVSPTLDFFMTKNYPDLQQGDRRELGLTPQEKADLLAFLLTLTDSTILTNPAFSNPF